MTLRDDCLQKLNDAKAHFADMQNRLADQTEFNRSLAAFLVSLRSPMLYMLFTANPNTAVPKPKPPVPTNTPMLRWYEAAMGSPVLRFFRDERSLDFHVRPVKPPANATVRATDSFNLTDCAQPVAPTTAADSTEQEETTWDYQFTDWTATPDKDVMRLCRLAISETEALINDGIAKGFIA